MLHISGRKMSNFLFLVLSVMALFVVVMLYNEIARPTRQPPRSREDTAQLLAHGGRQSLRSELLAQQRGVDTGAAEKWQQPYYGAQAQSGGVEVEMNEAQDTDEDWVEYKSDVRDPINDKYYFLLKNGGSKGNMKRSKKLKEDEALAFAPEKNPDLVYKPQFGSDNKVWHLESAHMQFKTEHRGLYNEHSRNNATHRATHRELGSQSDETSNRLGRRLDLPGSKVVGTRRVMPSAPHSLYRQPQESARYLVYVCDALSLCGGWGDRQRGMVSTYFLSRLVGRQLKILMPTPCDLVNFYIPNKVPWIRSPSQLSSFPNVTVNAISKKRFAYQLLERDFNEMFPQQVVYLRTNQDYYKKLEKNPLYQDTIRRWSGVVDKRSRFQWAWRDLMRPSPRLLAQLERVLGLEFLVRKKRLTASGSYRVQTLNSIGNDTLICSHVRYGKNPSFPKDNERYRYSLEDLPVLFSFMVSKDSSGSARFYTASDYQLVKDKAKEYFGSRVLDFGATVMHIDRQRTEDSACDGFESALLDQQILSLCDVLVVSRSGFSIHASYMAQNRQEVFIMEDGSIREFL